MDVQVVPLTSGSASTGERVPQIVRNSEPAIVLPQAIALAHRIGKLRGAGVEE